jgi:hypothetical protein
MHDAPFVECGGRVKRVAVGSLEVPDNFSRISNLGSIGVDDVDDVGQLAERRVGL